MWRIQVAVLCLIWSLTFFSTVRHSDAKGTEVSDEPNPLIYMDSLPPFSKIKQAHVVPGVMQAIEEFQLKFQEYENQLEANQAETLSFTNEQLSEIDDVQYYDYGETVSSLQTIEAETLSFTNEQLSEIDDVQYYAYGETVSSLQTIETTPWTWEFVEETLEKIQFPLGYSWQLLSHLISVKSTNGLREAQKTVMPIFANISARMSQSLPIYNAYKELKKQSESLDEAQNRILDSYLLSARLGGAELGKKDKTEFNKINLALHDATTKYSNNVLDSMKEYSLVLTDKESVDGLSERTRGLLASNAVEGTEQSADADEGPWKVTLDSPNYFPVMKNSLNRKLREDLYRAFITRACEGTFDNTKLIEQIREYRQKIAEILDFENYAELSLATKMVEKAEDVWNFLQNLRDTSYPVAESEVQKLNEYAQSKGHKGNLENWDMLFWKERQYEELYSIKEEDVRPYFPLDKVLSGLFKLSSELFGITIQAADGEADIWDPKVRFFKVYDGNETHIASFFLDSYSRPKEKKSGAWMDELFGRSRLLNHIPVVYLITNQVPPVGTTPSLMSFLEVTTLFHEFGHALQNMLTTIEYGGASGNHNIEWDAVEVASQFMENWLYDWSTISLISGHYQTHDSLPENMFQQFYRARQFFGGYAMQNQLYLSALDMELHRSIDPWQDVVARVADTYAIPKPLPEDCLPASFTHIFGSGTYAAGYYSYKWSELLAQDEFDEFFKVGLENRDKIKLVGKRYRDTVLSLGGGTHPLEVFQRFTGRAPSQDALLRKYGLFTEDK